MTVDAFKIAVSISLVENVTRGLASLSRYFKAADADAKALEARIAKIGKMAAAGGILAAAGAGGLKLLQGPLEEAKKYETELAKFRAMGLGDAVTAQADKFAKGMNVIGQSATQNIKLLREATAVMGDFGHAQEMMPHLARMKTAVEMYSGEGHGAKAENMMMDLLRVAELRGALKDPETFKRVTDLALKSYIASGGTVTPQQLLGAIKTGGVAAKGLSDDAFFFQELHLLQEMGGMRAGTSLMSAYQNLAQGRGSLRSAKVLQEMGLLDPNLIEYTKIGTIKQVKPGALKDSMTFMLSQFEYFEKEVKPQLEGLSKNDALMKIGSMFSNRTAAQRFSTFFLEENNLQKTAKMARQAMGVDAAVGNMGGTLAGKELDLDAKLANLKLELGQKILPLAVKGMEMLIGVVDRVVKFAKDFPGITKAAVLLTAALSGLALLAGGAMMFAAAFAAIKLAFPAALAAIGAAAAPATLALGAIAAVVYLIYRNWDEVKPRLLGAFELIRSAAIKLWETMRPFIEPIINAWKSIFDFIIGLIRQVASFLHLDWLVGGIDKALVHAYTDSVARDNAASYSNEGYNRGPRGTYVRPAEQKPIVLKGDVNIDGRKVGTVMWNQLGNELARPQTGRAVFNPLQSLTPPQY
ncbi:hypothetical protein M1M06_07485 [Ralstonia insidiosa]|uniref:hypothetical protein n=4 Tax=Pseudomonadota TaxID=1224 RepID=UPI00200A1AD5|nr:hypothetical protein [Ralstonia insidiosa]MCK8648885.1 hypothetical protein [Ralstonia insidiosa]